MVTTLLPSEGARWDTYVAARADATIYHLSAWRRVIHNVFGHRTHYLVASGSDGAITGVLPLARVKSRLFGDFLVSLPYVNYGGACADSPEVARELEAAAIDMARGFGVSHLELRSEAAGGTALAVQVSKVSMRLNLERDPETLWKRLGAKLRNQIRRPEREGVECRIGRHDQLDAFYDVFAANMRDLGTPVYPKALFEAVLDLFPDHASIVTIYRGRDAVAAGFLLGFRDRVEVPWASSLRAHNRIGVNVHLYWQMLKFCCERGYAVFDFGRSSPDSGPYQFKQQWGAQPVPLHWRHWVPEGRDLPAVNPQNPRFQQAIRIWQHLPVPLTRLLGPAIVRNIP
ncbi:MAG: FemAB family PEP-CTERM system-associated protein [Acidobacteria bacterium]|nr:FemAB family PEP-CTERM system-associated protein [Acidobacteriota bacterium]